MVAIKFTFTANRYHATQWGRHVNEGVLEWPPSPWRMLRGIVATWRRTLPELPSERVEPIVQAMASEYPKFHLPPASMGHTRHFMPKHETLADRKKQQTTLVLDSFVAIQPDACLFAVWPTVDLDSQQWGDLKCILRNMPYLGRAESWIEATLDSPPSCEPSSYALEDGAPPGADWEIVRTLVPHSHIGLRDLEVETAELRSKGRIEPEGAHWYPYVRKRDCFTSFRTAPPRPVTRKITVVRFALSGKVLPMAFDTLRWGDVARKAAMSKYGRQNNEAKSPTLSGKEESGKPKKGHQHAFYLPTDEDGDGRLDHLTIWVPCSLAEEEFKAIISVQELARGGGRDPLQLVYQAHGKSDDFVGVSPLFGKSKRWRSLTPYVLTRHRKRDSDSPEEQVAREVKLRPGLPQLVNVILEHNPKKRIGPMKQGRSDGFRPFDFFRYRQGGGSNAGGAFSFELEFEAEVCGPIALGFACHYGLGLFVPSRDLRLSAHHESRE